MKKTTRLVALVVAFVMLASMLPVAAFEQSDETQPSLEFTSYWSGYCFVSGIGDCGDMTDIVIPEYSPNGDIVEGIGSWAFADCQNIESVTIPKSVIYIDDYAFGWCRNLKEVNFAEDGELQRIENDAFYYCDGLESIELPDGLMSIYDRAFSTCTYLRTVTIPASVTSIGSYAFNNCGYLETIYYEGTQRQWNEVYKQYEWDCYAGISTENGIYAVEFLGPAEPESLDFYSYGDGTCCVAGVGTCSSTDIVVPSVSPDGDVVVAIANDAFNYCEDMLSVYIPASVKYIENFAFYNCSALTTVTFEDGSGLETIGDGAFIYCYELQNIELPEGIKTLGNGAFNNCDSLLSIHLPSSLEILGDEVFYDCDSLVTVTFGEDISIPCIPYQGFYGCESILEIELPDGIEFIDNYAFHYCTYLVSVTIPKSVTYIGSMAFGECYYLDTVYYCGNEKEWESFSKAYNWSSWAGSWTEDSTYEVEFLGPPAEKSLTFLSNNDGTCYVSGIGDFYNDSVITVPEYSPDGDLVTGIYPYAFQNYDNIEVVYLPDSIIDIDNYAFYDCENLCEIEIPYGVEYIGYQAFYNCNSLTSIEIPASVCNIGDYAFDDCDNLESVIFASGSELLYLENDTFRRCYSLVYIVLPDGLLSIGYEAFSCCSALESITIPATVNNISSWAFEHCYNLDTIYFEGNAREWDYVLKNYNWDYCTGENTSDGTYTLEFLGEPEQLGLEFYSNGDGTCYVSGIGTFGEESVIEIPEYSPNGDLVVGIGSWAFQYCDNLTGVYLPGSIRYIDQNAFYSCAQLTEVTLCEGLQTIEFAAFYNCVKLRQIYIPASVMYIGESAFNECNLMETVVFASGSQLYYIDDYVFKNCNSLSSIVIPEGVTSIGYEAFYGCSSLTSVSLPLTLGEIEGWAFENCYYLDTLYYAGNDRQWDNITKGNGWSSGTGYWTSDSTYTVEFLGEPYVESLEFYSNGDGTCSVSGIGDLYDESIIIVPEYAPNGERVTGIGPWAFGHCYNIETLYLPEGITYIDDCAFYNCSNLYEITLPESLRYICDEAFYNCDSLVAIEIPAAVSSVGASAFYGCDNLQIVTFASGSDLQSILEYTFKNCYYLESIALPDGLTFIGYEAFYECNSLESITIPQGVTYIDAWAFQYCYYLDNIYYDGTEAEWDSVDKGSNWDYYVGYYTADGTYTVVFSTISLPDVPGTEIPTPGNPDDNTPGTEIPTPGNPDDNTPETETPTPGNPDDDTPGTQLPDVDDPGSSPEISNAGLVFASNGDGTCYLVGVYELKNTTVTVPQKSPSGDIVTGIAYGAFAGCESIKKVVLPSTVTFIGDMAFADCYNLKSIEMPKNLEIIGVGAFENCSQLTSIKLPKTLISIGLSAFANCSNLKSVSYEGTQEEWDEVDKDMNWDETAGNDVSMKFDPCAFGHTYDNDKDTKCNVCEAVREIEEEEEVKTTEKSDPIEPDAEKAPAAVLGGCFGTVSFAGLALVATLGTCAVFVTKKKED